jgi:phosphatidylserine/phosphatidylglycerophosphate/cardiolipin synthase-like enzyme
VTSTWVRTATPALHVVVEPNATMGFLDRAISGARHSVLVEMYELADPTVERDLAARAAAHVAVQVLLDRDGDGGSVNAPAYSWLTSHHVPVRWANGSEIFHEKAVVVA